MGSQRAAQPLVISHEVRSLLESIARSGAVEHRLVQRAGIVLRAALGMSNVAIARAAGVTVDTARKWRKRFVQAPNLEGLYDAPRSGRPREVPMWVRLEVLKLACQRPKDNHARFRDVWTLDALTAAVQKATGHPISRSEVGRTLRAEELRPHKIRLWLHSPDPEFRSKVKAICDLYLNPPCGAHVVCVDEKTSIQALERIHPGRRPSFGQPGRFEFEYTRHRVRALIAGFDVQTGQVLGLCRPGRKAKDLAAFMETLAQKYPSGDVYVVWDNLNIHLPHCWKEFNQRNGGRFHFVYTPKHASWVNQIEIWFSILQRRVLRFGSFRSPKELTAAITGFIKHWNQYEAHPFRWTFTGKFHQHQRPLAV